MKKSAVPNIVLASRKRLVYQIIWALLGVAFLAIYVWWPMLYLPLAMFWVVYALGNYAKKRRYLNELHKRAMVTIAEPGDIVFENSTEGGKA